MEKGTVRGHSKVGGGPWAARTPPQHPAPKHLFPPLAQPGEEIQCRSSKPARRVASAGLTQESKGGMVPRPLRWARWEGKGRGAAQRDPTHLPGRGSSTDHLNFKAKRNPEGASHCCPFLLPTTSRPPSSTTMGLPARNYGACGSPQSKSMTPTTPPWSSPTSARKKP